MMFSIVASAALLAAGQNPASNRCNGDANCAELSPADMFALADKFYASGDKTGAMQVLSVLTKDNNIEYRAEARFRLAAIQEETGDFDGAIATLRALLAEQPQANPARLELARILDKVGKADEAKRELAAAQALGLPPEVAVTVRRFAGRLAQATKHRGLTLEVTAGPDSNINRSTSSAFIDTIIAPFELSEDARRIGGFGMTGVARAYSRDAIGPIPLLTRVNARADLYDKPRFNDVQLSADSGPEFSLGKAKVRPSAILERRWYGGNLYAKGIGGDVDLLAPLSPRTQIELRVARVKQTIAPNPDQDGWRTSAEASVTHLLAPKLTGQVSLRYGSLYARVDPESVRTWAGGALLAYEGKTATWFGEVDLTSSRGRAPLFLFGERRRDTRWDITAGVIVTTIRVAGFQPLVRATYSDSRADIVLWDYRRLRLDVGLTRSF
jgi:thioredoxin-like negative regulator of GroEL